MLTHFKALSLVGAATVAVALVLPAAAASVQSAVAQTQAAGIKRTDLQRHDLSAPGREAVQVRVDIAPGVGFPNHTHPGEEIIYVLVGSLEYQVEGKSPATLHAGDVLFIPAATVHAAKNVGSDTASELATYVVEKGKPLLTLN
jgi:quercetin dioxygenase-like cupin family protein